MTAPHLTQEEIFAKIVEDLSTTFKLDPARVTREASLYEDLDIDSIDAVDLAAQLQSQTGVRLTAETFKAVRTVGDLVLALDELLNGSAETSAATPTSRSDERSDARSAG